MGMFMLAIVDYRRVLQRIASYYNHCSLPPSSHFHSPVGMMTVVSKYHQYRMVFRSSFWTPYASTWFCISIVHFEWILRMSKVYINTLLQESILGYPISNTVSTQYDTPSYPQPQDFHELGLRTWPEALHSQQRVETTGPLEMAGDPNDL